MTKERLYVYDTTLRDGQQTQGVQFSLAEKQQIAATLDALGIDYIEAGGQEPIRSTAPGLTASPNSVPRLQPLA